MPGTRARARPGHGQLLVTVLARSAQRDPVRTRSARPGAHGVADGDAAGFDDVAGVAAEPTWTGRLVNDWPSARHPGRSRQPRARRERPARGASLPRSPAAARATRRDSAPLDRRTGLPGAIDACVAEGAREIVVMPYFLAPGRHATARRAAARPRSGARHPGVRIEVSAPLGVHAGLVAAVGGASATARGSARGAPSRFSCRFQLTLALTQPVTAEHRDAEQQATRKAGSRGPPGMRRRAPARSPAPRAPREAGRAPGSRSGTGRRACRAPGRSATRSARQTRIGTWPI